jgi:hypothetical protein
MSDLPMIHCDCSGTEPAFILNPILHGAPCGWICRACGVNVEVDNQGLSLPHQHVDILGMLS